MIKGLKKSICLLLVAVATLSVYACAGGDNTVELSYGKGMNEMGDYDASLYGYNEHGTVMADPGAIYVPKDRIHKDGKTYGGFYMFSTAGTEGQPIPGQYSDDVVGLEAKCYFSEDLNTWRLGGSEAQGYSLIGYDTDWEAWGYRESLRTPAGPWAPEVIYNETEKKYYMYYNTHVKPRGLDSEVYTQSSDPWDRLYIGIATSDYPMGPYRSLQGIDEFTGDSAPLINFKKHFGLDYDFPIIDVSPFIDDVDSDGDGQNDMYLYFTKDRVYDDKSGHGMRPRGSLVMKMKSWTEPDYDSLRYVILPGAVTCDSKTGAALVNAPERDADGYGLGVKGIGDFEGDEQSVNEGPFVIKHKGKYYITYSAQGFKSKGYTVYQAVSDSPVGPFTKIEPSKGNPILSGAGIDYLKGTGHHSFVSDGKELFIVYHAHSNVIDFENGATRFGFSDRVNWITNSDGLDYLAANGPSKILQWLPESVSGYKNLATEAKIKTSAGENVKYLTDSVLPFYAYNENMFFTASDDVEITFSFDKTVSVRSIMIYNDNVVDGAFSKINSIKFNLAEKPSWSDKNYKIAEIKNLTMLERYVDMDDETIICCAPAVAEFDELKVNSITINIAKEDRISEYDKFGNLNTLLNIAEIVILGR